MSNINATGTTTASQQASGSNISLVAAAQAGLSSTAGPNDQGTAMLFNPASGLSSVNAVGANLQGVVLGGSFSLSADVRFDGADSWGRIFDFGDGAERNNILVSRQGTSNNLTFQLFNGSTMVLNVVTTTDPIATGKWMNVTATYDADTRQAALYVDGVALGTGTAREAISTQARANNYVGRSNWGWDGAFRGAMDDVAVYGRALSASEVQELNVNQGLTVKQAAVGDVATGIEQVIGSAWADTITGDALANKLSGGAGNDTLNGGEGSDTLIGGAGDDTYVFDSATGLELITADGVHNRNDTVQFSKASGITLDKVKLARFTGYGQDNLNILVDGTAKYVALQNFFSDSPIKQVVFADGKVMSYLELVYQVQGNPAGNLITGTDANDSLKGTAAADVILGGKGNDTLDAGLGNDFVLGGDGNDTLYDGAGDDSVSGGAGNDRFMTTLAWEHNTFDGGDGIDTVDYGAQAYPDGTRDLYNPDSGVWVDLSAGQAWRYKLGTLYHDGAPDQLIGIENVTGSDLKDMLIGDAGANLINGGKGNDTLNGGEGSDTLIGGAGDDTYLFDSVTGWEWITPGSADNRNDTVQFSAASGITSDKVALRRYYDNMDIRVADANGSFETQSIVLQNFFSNSPIKQVIFADGKVMSYTDMARMFIGGDILVGGNGNDSLIGGGGNDLLIGLIGNDSLSGGSGNDIINGCEGNDTLNGGGGYDTLSGGSGADVFGFIAQGAGHKSTVTDFSKAEGDTLSLAKSAFAALNNLTTLSAANFYVKGDSGMQAKQAFIAYDKATGELAYDATGNGSTANVFAVLANQPIDLSYKDFVLM